jgi:hypothetical protein
MKVCIYPLGQTETIRRALVQDGWHAELTAENWIEATHVHVANQVQARERLYPIGLLTTGAARIEWEPLVVARPR